MLSRRSVLLVGLVACAVSSVLASGRAAAEPVKCQTAIAKASAKYVQDRSRALAKCEQGKIKGKPPAATDCETFPAATLAIAKARDKMKGAIAKACGGKDRKCGVGNDDDSIESIGWPSMCPALVGGPCVGSIAHCGDVADCLVCLDETATDGANGLDHGGLTAQFPKSKALASCQRALSGAAVKFLQTKSRLLEACWECSAELAMQH